MNLPSRFEISFHLHPFSLPPPLTPPLDPESSQSVFLSWLKRKMQIGNYKVLGKVPCSKLKTQKCLSSLFTHLCCRSRNSLLEIAIIFPFFPATRKNSFFPKRKSKNMKLIFCTAQCFIMPHVLRTYINGNVCGATSNIFPSCHPTPSNSELEQKTFSLIARNYVYVLRGKWHEI